MAQADTLWRDYAERHNLLPRDVEFVLWLLREEREACAKLAEGLAPADPTDSRHRGAGEASARIATAIRARS